MKKKKIKTPPSKWVVARSIYNNTDYEVWAICSSEEECKEWISNNVLFADDRDAFSTSKKVETDSFRLFLKSFRTSIVRIFQIRVL